MAYAIERAGSHRAEGAEPDREGQSRAEGGRGPGVCKGGGRPLDDCRKNKTFLNFDARPCQRHGLAVPRAGERSYVTGSIRGWSRSHLTYMTGGC